MKTDSFFQQGTTHEVCEDYALHGSNYVILSDGCSNGGGPRIDTDWGARFLCKTAEQFIQPPKYLPINTVVNLVCDSLQDKLRVFPTLNPECLTATLSIIRQHTDYDNCLECCLFGDGIFGGKQRDGNWLIYILEFIPGGTRQESAPYYLKYKMLGEEKQWEDMFGGNCQVSCYHGNIMQETFPETWTFDTRNKYWDQQLQKDHFRWNEAVLPNPWTSCYRMVFPIKKFEFVFIASDGLQSFYEMRKTDIRKYNEKVHVLDVVQVLMDLKNFRNGFARLQRNWVFKQDRVNTFVRRNWHNADDVAVGMVYCGDENGEI